MAAALQLQFNEKRLSPEQQSGLKPVDPWSEQQWQFSLKKHCTNISLLEPEYRLQWINALKDFISGNKKLEEKTLQTIINFAELVCDWQLVIDTFEKLPDVEKDINCLAYAYWKTNNWQRAFALLEHQMLLTPANHHIYSFYCYLIELANAQAFASYSSNKISSKLTLEPLACHHLDEFFWQYWDPDIAELCCLPTFENNQQWYDWLKYQQSLSDQTNYAVRHKIYGFIGIVSLVVHRQVGFFYFWIGKDFQGMGFGTDAVSLLLELGREQHKINCCYAKVFEHNIASQKAMHKLGFKRLSFNAAPPWENEQLYYSGKIKSETEQCTELQQLFTDMNSETEVDMPLTMKLYDSKNNKFLVET